MQISPFSRMRRRPRSTTSSRRPTGSRCILSKPAPGPVGGLGVSPFEAQRGGDDDDGAGEDGDEGET